MDNFRHFVSEVWRMQRMIAAGAGRVPEQLRISRLLLGRWNLRFFWAFFGILIPFAPAARHQRRSAGRLAQDSTTFPGFLARRGDGSV